MNKIATLILFFFSGLVASELISDRLTHFYSVVLFKSFKYYGELVFLFLGIIIGFAYLLKFGSKLFVYDSSYTNADDFYDEIPYQSKIRSLGQSLWKTIETTTLGYYLSQIYSKPVQSEHILGSFFFSKTLLTTAIAFYHLPTLTLVFVLLFSTLFDSLTGTYQQTLMNFFHRSVFKNRFFSFIQNLGKRYFIDIFRAQIITLFIMGLNTFSYSEQFHIFQNRFVSASYYFNAVLIDKLVEVKVISRNFRSRFIIFASTIGGMLCLLDFARTDFPSWVSPNLIQSIPNWIPGPLKLLAYFNISVFIMACMIYFISLPQVTFYLRRSTTSFVISFTKLFNIR